MNEDINKDYSRQKARKMMVEHFGILERSEVVHHIDHDPLNNDINNLVVIDNGEHISYHATHKAKYTNDSLLKDLSNLESLLAIYNTNIA